MSKAVVRRRVTRSKPHRSARNPSPIGPALIASGLLGAGGMVLEISLTRVFATLLFYNYVFLVITVALLGLGLGALAVAMVPRLRAFPARRAGDFALLAGISATAVAILASSVIPPDMPILSGAIAMVPFIFIGAALSLLFAIPGASPNRLYGADLIGAAAGALAAMPLLYLGAPTAVIVAGVLLGLAAVAMAIQVSKSISTRALSVLMLLGIVILSATIRPVDISLDRMTESKPLSLWLRQGEATVLRSTSDPFSRIDVVTTTRNPLDRLLFIDGAAGSTLPHYPTESDEELKRRTELGAFPYLLVNGDRVLVIGSGGGLGVLYGLLAGATDITALEVSPGAIDAVRASGEYSGYLYDRPGVTVVNDEGRSYLNRSDERFDIIDMSMVVSLSAASGGLALAENYLFTEEAFRSVWDHLDENGIAVVRMYDDPTLTRAVVTSISALREATGSDAAALSHMAVVFNPKETTTGSPAFYPQLLISKQPFTREAATLLLERATRLGFTVMFAPHVQEVGLFGEIVRGDVSLEQAVPRMTGGTFTPVTDDSPFFFEMTGGLPRQLQRTWYAVAIVLVAAAAIAAIARRRTLRSGVADRKAIVGLPYFVALGVGFMLVEIVLIARIGIFIGHPTVAFAVVLSGLMLFGGIGSILAQRIHTNDAWKYGALAAVLASLLSVVLFVLFRPDSALLGGAPLAWRVAVGLLAVAPMGLLLGVPFPTGIRLYPGPAALPFAINGAASVVGTVLATTVAILFGYTAAIAIGVLAYVAAAIHLVLLHRPARADRTPNEAWVLSEAATAS